MRNKKNTNSQIKLIKKYSDLEYENIDFGLGLYSSYTNSTG